MADEAKRMLHHGMNTVMVCGLCLVEVAAYWASLHVCMCVGLFCYDWLEHAKQEGAVNPAAV